MDICLLINEVAPGGAPTVVLDIVRQTDDPDVSYTVCIIEGERTLVPELREAGATVVDFDASFKFDPRALWRMARFFRRNDFDIVHAHLPYAQFLGRVLGGLGGTESIVSTQHNVPENYHPITRTLERLTRSLDTRTIAVSEGVERAFTGQSARYEPGQHRQWCTIYNGIDAEVFANAVHRAKTEAVRERWGIEDAIVFLNVSRYVDAKAQLDLIAAMESLGERRTDVHLLLVGWGEREPALRAAVEQRGLGNLVTVTGKVPTVHEYYALGDVFVSSSVFEGLPIAHLEAMAAGLPVVATEIAGVTEVVRDGVNGRLVPPKQPEELASAMAESCDNERREPWGTASSRLVREQFSIEQTVEDHLSLYLELANERRK
ncbi:glycosyltransferase [Haloarcula onubensis]|uniref:Glycosyltransferase n=1 Tax=Haloarcula onubensis TaxID=2950539 RepID=A0ABU2FNE5_9EURY|nr:glycosyltransferase [Halomicroarcula sp. S3CR25-11]MDS0282275.1 glycosyltransferase [Halomicroarcula sp. S3CR25-11]